VNIIDSVERVRILMNDSYPIFLSRNQVLANNLRIALRVAGPADEDGRPTKLRHTMLQRESGIARSTLCALMNEAASPDLATLYRIADQLGVHPAFLLLGPSDWQALIAAVNDLKDGISAATTVSDSQAITGPESGLAVLAAMKVYPNSRSLPVTNEQQAATAAMVRSAHEKLRRAALVTTALAQTSARTADKRLYLTAFAATLANHFSRNPTRTEDADH
jgi:hypothetical protein